MPLFFPIKEFFIGVWSIFLLKFFDVLFHLIILLPGKVNISDWPDTFKLIFPYYKNNFPE